MLLRKRFAHTMMVALRCATSERVQSFVYIYSECYAIIQVIKKEED